ncbi:MAG: hypothetical protein FWC69_02625 [Defluviitaleaceae bacterium]|nr:hypothetical protein [Defluviitaleaceae bacterium]
MYRDDELIYTVDASIFGMLYFSNDGTSFLEIGWWIPTTGNPSNNIRQREMTRPVIRFFREGNLVHHYDVFDLVTNRNSIVLSIGHAQWDYQNQRYHDRENNTLMVRTRDGNDITFDLTTGLILSSYSHSYSDSDVTTQSIATQSLVRIRTIVAVLSIILLAIR